MARAGQRPLCGAAVPAGDSLRWWEDESALRGLSASPTSLTPPAPGGARAAGTELTLWRGWTPGHRPGGVLAFLGPAPARSYFRPLSRGPGLPRSRGWASRGPRWERPVAPPRCALGPAACTFFSGARAPGKDFVRLGRAAPRNSRAAAPQVFPFLEETGESFLREIRGLCVQAAGSRGAAPRGGSGAGPRWPFLRGGASPPSPVGNRVSAESAQGPALAWAGIRGTSLCQGWAVGGAQREACPLPKPLGGSPFCFLGVPGCFRLFSE